MAEVEQIRKTLSKTPAHPLIHTFTSFACRYLAVIGKSRKFIYNFRRIFYRLSDDIWLTTASEAKLTVAVAAAAAAAAAPLLEVSVSR